MNLPRISVTHLSKLFPRHERVRVKGVSTDGLASLRYLLKKTWSHTASAKMLQHSDSKNFVALNEISFDVHAGEVLGIIGRNGAGKTTLLKILARVLDPSAGKVVIRGKVMSMLELGIGFAPHLTVRENIQIQGRLAGLPAKRIAQVEESILDFAGLTDFRNTVLSACPSGSFTQLGFSAMVNFDVDIILADEVLAVGDSTFRKACEDRVKAAGQSGESVLFVSHDLNAIRRICNRVVWIDKGRIIQSGPTDEVVAAYTQALMKGHLLSPASNESGCRLLDFRLLDTGYAPVGALQISDGGYIDCLLQVLNSHAAPMIEFQLWQGKYHIFSSPAEKIMCVNQSTTYQISLKVPAHFLNELLYTAVCRLFTLNAYDNTIHIIEEQRLDFYVMNTNPAQSVWSGWSWGRSGIVSPGLEWNVDVKSTSASEVASIEPNIITS